MAFAWSLLSLRLMSYSMAGIWPLLSSHRPPRKCPTQTGAQGHIALPEEVNGNVKVFLQNHSEFSILQGKERGQKDGEQDRAETPSSVPCLCCSLLHRTDSSSCEMGVTDTTLPGKPCTVLLPWVSSYTQPWQRCHSPGTG